HGSVGQGVGWRLCPSQEFASRAGETAEAPRPLVVTPGGNEKRAPLPQATRASRPFGTWKLLFAEDPRLTPESNGGRRSCSWHFKSGPSGATCGATCRRGSPAPRFSAAS